MQLNLSFSPPFSPPCMSSFVCIHCIIVHAGHKTYRSLNWTEVPNALKEFMSHNCTGLPENKQWYTVKIFSQGDDSDPSSWLRPCLTADGTTCNLFFRCRAAEAKQKGNGKDWLDTGWENKSCLQVLEALESFICFASRKSWAFGRNKTPTPGKKGTCSDGTFDLGANSHRSPWDTAWA